MEELNDTLYKLKEEIWKEMIKLYDIVNDIEKLQLYLIRKNFTSYNDK